MMKQEFVSMLDLEARIAALFVQNASRFESRLMVSRGSSEVNCKSIMGVVALNIREGETITITATGADEEAALDTMVKMLSGVKS